MTLQKGCYDDENEPDDEKGGGNFPRKRQPQLRIGLNLEIDRERPYTSVTRKRNSLPLVKAVRLAMMDH